MPTFFH